MELNTNALIEWQTVSAAPRLERVLWVEPNGSGVFTIAIDDPKAWPVYRKAADIEADLATNAASILQLEPNDSVRPEEGIDPNTVEIAYGVLQKHTHRMAYRDQ
jgi:hypothetical protein